MGVLALNACFEPLTIVPARRAVRLVLDRKAEILEASLEVALDDDVVAAEDYPGGFAVRHQYLKGVALINLLGKEI